MKILRIALFACLAQACGSVAFAAIRDTHAPARTEVEVVDARFGIFKPNPPGKPVFVPTRTVPYQTNQSYGWIITLKTRQRNVHWREVFTLPASPKTWGQKEPAGTRKLSEDKRVSVTERVVSAQGGRILNVWSVAPGDPKGHYVIKVYVEDVPAGTFEFDVQ